MAYSNQRRPRGNGPSEQIVNPTKVLTREEIRTVVRGYRALRKRCGRKRPEPWLAFIVFRLSCCCGLRVKEIRGLNLGDLIGLDSERPVLRIRKAITKGQPHQRRARLVPLWWDSATLQDLREWYAFRVKQVKQWYEEGLRETVDYDPETGERMMRPFTGEPDNEPLVCIQFDRANNNYSFSAAPNTMSIRGTRLTNRITLNRWKSALRKSLPKDRAAMPCHNGRHSFITHALYSGRNLAEVRDAVGHANISMTSEYLHVLDSDEAMDVFAFAEPLAGGRVQPRKRGGHTGADLLQIVVPRWVMQHVVRWANARGINEPDDALAEMVREITTYEQDATMLAASEALAKYKQRRKRMRDAAARRAQAYRDGAKRHVQDLAAPEKLRGGKPPVEKVPGRRRGRPRKSPAANGEPSATGPSKDRGDQTPTSNSV